MNRFINNIILTLQTIDNLGLFFADYFGLVTGDIIYKIRNKPYKFIARAGSADKSEIVAVMSGFEYRCNVLPKMNNPIIFDIGAYIGDSAIYFSHYFNNNCKIFSFEPDNENYKYCLLNLLLNNNQNTVCYNIAVGAKSGKGFLIKGNKSFDAYSLAIKKSTKGISCPVKTLSDLAKDTNVIKIDILKMDIEGGEYPIFNSQSSYSFIKQNVKYILLEYHYDFGIRLVEDLLRKLEKDFTILHHRDNLICLANKQEIILN